METHRKRIRPIGFGSASVISTKEEENRNRIDLPIKNQNKTKAKNVIFEEIK